jgi:hypothetical protein
MPSWSPENWVPVSVHQERYDKCRSCEHSAVVEPELVCNLCGCLLLGMTREKDKSCPANKWGVWIEGENQ